MIGNVICAIDNVQLNNLIEIRKNFKYNYIKELNEKTGQNFSIPKCKVIVIDDLVINQDDFIGGSILLPDGKAMYSLIENDYNNFSMQYINKLSNDPNIREYLTILLSGLIEKGFDYIIYFNNNDYQMALTIANVLFGYLYNMYGMIVYSYDNIINQPSLLLNQSIHPEKLVFDKQLIEQYGYALNNPGLFYNFGG